MWVELSDGWTIAVPLARFPRLDTVIEQQERYLLGLTGSGLHWEELDEDTSVEGLLAGRGGLTVRRPVAA